MKPLNEEERSKQFFIFLGFFLVTIALVIGIAYFPLRHNPKNEEELLKAERGRVEMEGNSNDKSLMQIDSLLSAIKKLRGSDEFQFDGVSADAANKRSLFAQQYSENKFLSKYAEAMQQAIEISNEKQKLNNLYNQLSREKIIVEKKNTALTRCMETNGIICN